MNLRTLKYRLKRWLNRTFNPPRYYVASYGGFGLDVQFFTNVVGYEIAVRDHEEAYEAGRLDSFTHGEVE